MTCWLCIELGEQSVPNNSSVSKNLGKKPNSSILIGFFIINHPILGYHYLWKHPYTPWKINILNPKNGGGGWFRLFPFSIGCFLGSSRSFSRACGITFKCNNLFHSKILVLWKQEFGGLQNWHHFCPFEPRKKTFFPSYLGLEKNPLTFHHTCCLIRDPYFMVYYIPYKTG